VVDCASIILSIIGSYFDENYAVIIIGTFSHLDGNNRLVCKVSFRTCTLLHSVQYSTGNYKLGNTLVGQLWPMGM